MPVGNIFVGYTGGNVKHDNSALALDVITISETSELFLASCVPNIESGMTNLTSYSVWILS